MSTLVEVTPLDAVVSAACNLHLGAGYNHYDGWLNCDLYPTPATDLVFDLEQAPWPLADNSQIQIYASHCLEHLTAWPTFFQEAWRVLQPGGRLQLRVPYGMHPAAWWDMGHVRPWVIECFVFFQPGYAAQIGNPQHAAWAWPFHVEIVDVRLSGEAVALLRRLPWRWLRQLVLPWLRQGALVIEELFVSMTALKSAEAVQQWRLTHAPNVLATNYVCWQHHWEGRPLAPREVPTLHTLGIGCSLNGYA